MAFKVYKMSEKEYAAILEKVRQRNMNAAHSKFNEAIRPWMNEPTAQVSRRTGLTPSTVLKYKKGKWGKRGPMFTTYLALIRGRV